MARKGKSLYIKRALEDDEVRVLGICLGAQLIAEQLGANVRKCEQKEIGFFSKR